MLKKFFKYVFSYIRRLDKLLLLLTLALCALGVVLLYSIMVNSETQAITDADITGKTVKVQIFAIAVGIFIAAIVAAIDYRWYSKLWFIYLPATLGLTMLTFTSLGTSGLEGSDDKAWINLGFMTVQPAEFLKLAFILSLSYHCYKSKDFLNNPLNVAGLLIHGAIPTVIVMLQGDDGTAIVFMCIFLAIIFAAGISWKYILSACIISPIAFYVLWSYYLQDVHKKRILSIINPEKYSTPDLLYQTNHSLIALGSGQLKGKGLFGGDYSYVPVCHSDFIFSYAGQTLGFIGCLVIIIALGAVCLKVLSNGLRSPDSLGRYICTGVFAYLFIHCILNIGMVMGVTPVIGIPLPFLSAGGSAILTATVSIGLAMSVYYRSSKFDNLFKDN